MKTLHEKLQDIIVKNTEQVNFSDSDNLETSSTDSQDIIMQEQENLSIMFSNLKKMFNKMNNALILFKNKYLENDDDMLYFLNHNNQFRKLEKELNEFQEMKINLQKPNSKNDNWLRKSSYTNLLQSTSTTETEKYRQHRTQSQINVQQFNPQNQLQEIKTEQQKLQNKNNFQQIQELLNENLKLKKLIAEQKNKLFQFWRIVFKYQDSPNSDFTNYEDCQQRIKKSFELNIFYNDLINKVKKIFTHQETLLNQNYNKDNKKNNWQKFFQNFFDFFLLLEDEQCQECVTQIQEDFLLNFQESIAQSFFTFRNQGQFIQILIYNKYVFQFTYYIYYNYLLNIFNNLKITNENFIFVFIINLIIIIFM